MKWNLSQIINEIMSLKQRMQQIEEKSGAATIRAGNKLHIGAPVVDMEHVGRLSDVFEHGTESPHESQQQQILMHRAQRAYYIDPSGNTGRSWKHIVTPSNATDEEIETGEANLAVDGWVP